MRRHALALLTLTAGPVALPSPVAAQTAAADPARLAEAKRTIDHIFPTGTYRRMMGGNFSRMMEGISAQMLDMKVKDVVAMGGANEAETAKMTDATIRQVMEIVDPAFEQRNKAMFDGMMTGMADIMNGFEPEIRDALSEAYAAKFTTAQLKEMNAFFATPTGSLYAENAMTLAMDPAFMEKIMKLTPRIMQAMPRIAADAVTKTKGLPPRRNYASLSKTEKARLSALLGLSDAEAAKAVDALEQQQKKREDGA
ncbi:MAG: DUF2059 domain-containing protein [Sphingobium sp.]